MWFEKLLCGHVNDILRGVFQLVSVKTDTPLSSSAVIVTRLRLGKGGVKWMTPAAACGPTLQADRQTES